MPGKGFSQRRIVRELGVHRKTVKRLLEERSGSEGSKRATVMTGNRALDIKLVVTSRQVATEIPPGATSPTSSALEWGCAS